MSCIKSFIVIISILLFSKLKTLSAKTVFIFLSPYSLALLSKNSKAFESISTPNTFPFGQANASAIVNLPSPQPKSIIEKSSLAPIS